MLKQFLFHALIAVAALVVGVSLGVSANVGGKYEAGRLSACKDMLSVMVKMNPVLGMAEISCVPLNGDAAIKVGEGLFSLDGTKKLN